MVKAIMLLIGFFQKGDQSSQEGFGNVITKLISEKHFPGSYFEGSQLSNGVIVDDIKTDRAYLIKCLVD